MSDRYRLAFAGTPEFAVPSLTALLDSGHDVACVLTQPDRPAGRGRQPRPSPVKRAALAAGCTVRQPATLRHRAIADELDALSLDCLVVAAYGLMLPRAILGLPRRGCLNVHASLLPRWRGAAPIQRALLTGDAETGISLMQMVAALDAGPVYSRHRLAIEPDESGGQLHDRLAVLGADALRGDLDAILAGRLVPEPQDEAAATHAAKLTKDEGRLDWHRPAAELARQVRALDPWPVAEAMVAEARVRIWRAHALSGAADEPPGRVVAVGADGIRVATGDGLLCITELQWPGRRRLPAIEFARGRTLTGEQFA